MGKAIALRWFIGVFIYFAVFLFVASIVDNFEMKQYLDVGANFTGFCDTPREAFNVNGLPIDVSKSSDRCIHTRVAFDEVGCGQLNGCTWENESSSWFWNTPAGCYGDLNESFYSPNESIGIFGNWCDVEAFQNENDCYNLGCEWNTDPEEIDVTDSKGVVSLAGRLFTFQYDFGFEEPWETGVTLLLVYLPTLMLIGSIYFMLPFIH